MTIAQVSQPLSRRGLNDHELIVLTVGVAFACLAPLPALDQALVNTVRVAAIAVAGLAWLGGHPRPLIAALVAFALVHANAAWSEAASVAQPRDYQGPAALASDPEPVPGGVRVRAVIGGERFDLRAWGSPAGWLRNRLMGEVVEIDVSLRPLHDPPRWVVAQGLDGRGTVRSMTAFREGPIHTRIANSVRRTIASGARSLDRDDRALFTGLVYGDDRDQNPLMLDDFDAAGLSHLVAVSGQNVAFSLAIVGPLLRRLGHRARWGAVGAVLLLFATMTRFEPSVLRASAMAAIAATGALVGTTVPATRVLALAGVSVLLWRPMMIYSVGFQLSVAASAGILLWSARLARAIPGPRLLAEACAVTASAQLAVAPLLLWRFGGVPVAALPANLAAGPPSGPVMMWGMTAGWLAGLVPEPMANVLHIPTRLGVRWIAAVARWSASVSLGELGWLEVLAIGALASLALRQVSVRRRIVVVALVGLVLVIPALRLAVDVPASGRLPGGTVLIVDGGRTLAMPEGRPQNVLADLRQSGIDRLDVLALDRSSFANANLIGWLASRYDIGAVWAPEPTLGVGERVPGDGEGLRFGDGPVVAHVVDGRLVVALDAAD